MNTRRETKRANLKLWVICVVIVVGISGLAFKVILTPPVKAKIVRATSTTKWSEFQTLTKMLSIGMNPPDVQRILGTPNIDDSLSIGERWIYLEEGPTAGWTCVVEFKHSENGQLNLCYVLNVQHRAFSNSPKFELGESLKLKKPEGTVLFGFSNGVTDTNQ